MTSPNRSVVVRLAMDTSSYISGASRAEASTLSLDKAVQRVGPSAATSMEKAAKGAAGTETAMGKLNKTAGALGLTLGGLAGVGSALAVGMSVKWAADYQSALTRLVTTAGESPKNIKAVGQAFLDMAGQVGISADEIAKGAYTAESAGFHGADAVTVMKAASEGARQENADLGKVVNATTTILHDYHLKASDAATVTSQLITAVSHGKVSFDELTGALDAITPLAARANISIADVTGTLAAMTASGMSADQATQNMQNTLLHLVNPSNTMIAELAQLGVSTDDLAKSLSTRGLAGTLQMVEEAIVKHVDPATQRVLLPAFNQSKSAAQDLQIMISKMPPELAKLSQALLNGTETQKDYRKAALEMGGQAGVLGDNFLTLYKSADGFNNVLKAGGPNAQVFTAAMAKAFGTESALNVALQTTGENAGATNAAIKDIAGATAQADGNIKGWSEVQGNFNQQLAEFEAHAKSLAIEAGQHLLPALTATFSFANETAIPALEHLGSGAMSAAHWWSGLPGPIKDVSLALAGLALAEKIGLIDRMSTVVGSLTGGVGRLSAAFREEVSMQRWAATVQGIAGAAPEVETGLSRMAVAGGLAKRALGGLESGASSLMGVFGGPWAIAIGGAVALLPTFMHFLQGTPTIAEKAAQSVQAIADAIQATNGQLDETVRRSVAAQLQQDGLFQAAQRWGVSTKTLTDAVMGNAEAMDTVRTAAAKYNTTLSQLIPTYGNTSGAITDAQQKSDQWLAALNQMAGGVDTQVQKQQQLSQAVYGTANTVDGLKGALQQMSLTSQTTWADNVATVHGATAAQIQDLRGLGATVKSLPNGDITVTADTSQASSALDGLLRSYQHVQYTGSAIVVNGRVIANAAGNLLPMSATSASIVQPGALRVIGDNPVADEAFIPINSSARSLSILGETAARMGLGLFPMAAGGVLSMGDRFWAQPSQSMLDSVKATALAAASPYAGMVSGATSQQAVQMGARMAAARGWNGPQFMDLFSLWMRESGWNPYAVNPSSGAYGIPQSLGHGHPYNLGDIAAQEAWGMDYIAQRFGTPANAWAHEVNFGWYDGGGPLNPGWTLAFNGTGKRETIRTADQEAVLQRVLRSREFGGMGTGPTTAVVATQSAPTTVIGVANYGTVHMDPDELARRGSLQARQLLVRYGLS